MKIKTYPDMRVTRTWNCTYFPASLVKAAVRITQKKDDIWESGPASDKLCKFLLDADHLSVVEHCSITLFIEDVSRSFLAQLTRHRIASYTVSSQHYQDYRDYPVIVHPDVRFNLSYISVLEELVKSYISAVDAGIPNYEARQLLPNASACNILMTINARSLINLLEQRLCNRNTDEINIFAKKVSHIAKHWFPQLFKWVGPRCAMAGKCNQGRMSCGKPWTHLKG